MNYQFMKFSDLPENDYLAKTISHKLYDYNPETIIASAMLLGLGGARLLEHSGMTAAMNGAVNLSIPDGWLPEFVIPPADPSWPEHQEDDADADNLFDVLEKEIIPMYYDYPDRWLSIVKNSMHDIMPRFGSNRMAAEYYEKLYTRITN